MVATLAVSPLRPLVVLTLPPCIMWVLLEFTPGMYRWAGPSGTPMRSFSFAPKLATETWNFTVIILIGAVGMLVLFNSGVGFLVTIVLGWLVHRGVRHLDMRNLRPTEPVSVTIDYSVSDRALAEYIIQETRQAGHKYVEYEEKIHTDVILVLLSRFKTSTRFNLTDTTSRVYPVLYDTVDYSQLDDNLKRIQWIDIRQDTPTRVRLMMRLLATSDELIERLGVLPGRQVKRNAIVNFTAGMLSIMAGLRLASIGVSVVVGIPMIAFGVGSLSPAAIVTIPLTLISVFGAYHLISRLDSRSGGYSSFLIWLFGLTLVSVGGLYILLYLLAFFYILLKRQQLKFWFPG
jgi:hypothetical protein